MTHTRTSRTAIALLAVTVALAATSCSSTSDAGSRREARTATSTSSPTTTTSRPHAAARPTADVDRTVRVDGHRVHLSCRGHGERTVVLVAGFTDGAESWDPIVGDVAKVARVCSYDRFGTGSSDPAPSPQTFRTQAESLHGLLVAAGEPGPYVTVGHSFGGLVAATYASMYSEEVRGLLLLDASSADWNRAVCAVPDLGTSATGTWVQSCAMQGDPARNPESLDGPRAFAEVAQIDDLGSVPLIVDQAADEGYGAMGFPTDVAGHLTDVWDRGQRRWASMSSHGQLHRVAGTGHYIHRDRPEVVVEQITELVDNP